MVEDYIDGITIGEMLEVGRYSSKEVEKIILELCDALDSIHKMGIVHRDIKPENIIIDNSGKAWLIDFNISRLDKEDQNKDTVMLGTTGFAAPEQYGISQTDARSDIYSIGILINVMLTGEHPARKMCSGSWEEIVNRCTKINPDDRYANVKELVGAIKAKKKYAFIPWVAAAVLIIGIAVGTVTLIGKIKPKDTEVAKGETQSSTTTTVGESDETEKSTITQPATEEQTTEETTTEEVTTEETTTEEPTTEEPTTLAQPEVVIAGDTTNKTFTYIGEYTGENFRDIFIGDEQMETIESVVISEGATNVPNNAFQGCTNLKEVVIPNTVVTIGYNAFSTTALEHVTLPESVVTLQGSVFANNGSLKSIDLPQNLKTIGDACFFGAGNLETLTIPPSVESIGVICFDGCANLVIYVPPGSYAKEYCIANEMRYEYV